MMTKRVDEIELLRSLASSLDCVLEHDLCLLANVKPTTTEAWRKRHTGPPYVRFGNTFMYPRLGLAEHLKASVREGRDGVLARELL